MEIYTRRISRFRDDLSSSRKKDKVYGIVRFVVILAALGFLYLAISEGTWAYVLSAAGLLLLFVILLVLHRNLREYIEQLKAYIRINQNELAYLKADLSAFGDGSEFLEQEHLYARDLDIFGKQSLFQHLNRSASLEGKQLLAQSLANHQAEGIEERQEAVRELAADLDFRQEFLMQASLFKEDPNLKKKLRLWEQSTTSGSFVQRTWFLYLMSAVALTSLVYWLSMPGLQSFYVFVAAAGINLAVVGSQMKRIKREYGQLSGISSSVLIYSRLLLEIENRQQKASLLQSLASGLTQGELRASGALKKLSRILDAFDQLNNILGALLMNGLFLYHLHILRELETWKKNYSSHIHQWLRVVGEFDRYSSLGNYAFNHPGFSFPKISDEVGLSATMLGHPMIAKNKRVVNSIDFSSFKYVILTGSNMSGKSTFLRTLGVNLVLAKAGAPVCATEMRFYPFKLLSSMKPEDSIQKEVSYFQAEVLRLKRIREELAKEEPSFLLLDEILRGTNSDDKRNGTRLFMKKVAGFNARGVIATHDIDIAELAGENPQVFQARYFESKFALGELHFDYKLREGVCTTPNATELMRAQGII